MDAKAALEATNKVVSTGYTYISIDCNVPLERQRENVELIRAEKECLAFDKKDATDYFESLPTEPLKILKELDSDFG